MQARRDPPSKQTHGKGPSRTTGRRKNLAPKTPSDDEDTATRTTSTRQSRDETRTTPTRDVPEFGEEPSLDSPTERLSQPHARPSRVNQRAASHPAPNTFPPSLHSSDSSRRNPSPVEINPEVSQPYIEVTAGVLRPSVKTKLESSASPVRVASKLPLASVDVKLEIPTPSVRTTSELPTSSVQAMSEVPAPSALVASGVPVDQVKSKLMVPTPDGSYRSSYLSRDA